MADTGHGFGGQGSNPVCYFAWTDTLLWDFDCSRQNETIIEQILIE